MPVGLPIAFNPLLFKLKTLNSLEKLNNLKNVRVKFTGRSVFLLEKRKA
jgi:hypothetical protein